MTSRPQETGQESYSSSFTFDFGYGSADYIFVWRSPGISFYGGKCGRPCLPCRLPTIKGLPGLLFSSYIYI